MSVLSAKLPDPFECFPSKRRRDDSPPPMLDDRIVWVDWVKVDESSLKHWLSVLSEFKGASSENEGGLDDTRSVDNVWMTDEAGLLSPPPPHRLSLDLPLGTCDSQVFIQNWNKLESNGSLDREDNHDNRASSENEDRLLGCRSYDDQLSKPKNTLPVSSTEISKESNEINGVEGFCEVRSVAGNCPVRHPSAVQLLSVSSDHSNCLDVNSWMEGRHRTPLPLWLRDMFSQPIHYRPAGTIFGNLKPKNVLMMNDRLFRAQLSYIKKNNMDLSLVKSTPEAEDLFSRLLKKNPELSRLEAREVILHPFSWRSNVKLHFLQQMSAKLHEKNPAPDPDLLTELQSNEPPVFYGNWIDKLDPIFKTYALQRILQRKEKKLNFTSVVDLVRFMRNKSAHLNEFPNEIKDLFGPGEEGFYTYFDLRFPRLFMKFYGAAFQFCREEEWFEVFHMENFPEYFGSDAH